MNNIFDEFRYALLEIDVTDTYPMADFFDDEKYLDSIRSNNVEELLDHAVNKFWKENPSMKTYSDWEEKAEEGATEYEIVNPNGKIFRSSMLLLPHVMGAIFLIRSYHGGQIRKGDGFPYIEHPLEVGYKLWRNGFDIDVVVAGLCHDLLEDTKCTEKEIEEGCGSEVLRIVKAVSNDESLSDKKDWELKKTKYVESVRLGGEKAIAVSVADKISNLNSFFIQYEKEGPSLWKKFNRGKDKKIWFEKEVIKMAKENWDSPLIAELETLVKKLEATKE